MDERLRKLMDERLRKLMDERVRKTKKEMGVRFGISVNICLFERVQKNEMGCEIRMGKVSLIFLKKLKIQKWVF